MSESIFHKGELTVQKMAGEQLIAERNCSMVQRQLTMGMELYIKGLPIFFVSSMDEEGNLWASVLSGEPGFCTSPNSSELIFNTDLLKSDPEDIFWRNLTINTSVGMLFIDLETRRRLRINGKTSHIGSSISIKVEQCFPNCPKYIQRRRIDFNFTSGKSRDNVVSEWIADADTCFVASAGPEKALDVSHRGGKAGFIFQESENLLVIPDYTGNSMFNTLGNFFINPNAGMLFLDFRTGNTLQLSGTAELCLKGGTKNPFREDIPRFWKFHIKKKIFKRSLTGISFGFLDFSPFNP